MVIHESMNRDAPRCACTERAVYSSLLLATRMIMGPLFSLGNVSIRTVRKERLDKSCAMRAGRNDTGKPLQVSRCHVKSLTRAIADDFGSDDTCCGELIEQDRDSRLGLLLAKPFVIVVIWKCGLRLFRLPQSQQPHASLWYVVRERWWSTSRVNTVRASFRPCGLHYRACS